MSRRSYPVGLEINGLKITTVVIDTHYELKHLSSINDDLILELVATLDGGYYPPKAVTSFFKYYVEDGLIYNNKRYRLVWLIEKGEAYIGVINAFRRPS